MGKSNIMSNGQLLVGLDKYGQVDDLYFPYVGLENHASGQFTHKIGVMVDDKFSWLEDSDWEICFNCEIKDRRRLITATNMKAGVQLKFHDEVYNEKNIFLRGVEVYNQAPKDREIKIFFNQQFEIYESHRGDTAYFDPDENVIIHYKGRRVFLINAKLLIENTQFDDYTVDQLDLGEDLGAYKDAEDGMLNKRAIEYGLVDSCIGFTLNLEANTYKTIEYWLTVGKSIKEVYELNEYVKKKTPAYLIESTRDYWKAWISKIKLDYKDLSDDVIWLYERSLEVMRLNTDNTGAIIASIDADLLKYGRDTYSYVWPRDASFVTMAFAKSGYDDQNKKVFEFFRNVLSNEGYLLQKYRADGSVGSSWHPWVQNGKKEYPIQLDETALVICALYEEFINEKDIEFIENIYNDLVVKSINFIISRIDETTGIVKPSYDLWEEEFITTTFTSCAVYGALISASKIAAYFGKELKTEMYSNYAEKVKNAILKYHYDEQNKVFYKGIYCPGEKMDSDIRPDKILDSSCLYGLFKFNVLEVNDPKLISMKDAVSNRLQNTAGARGYPRYEHDIYFRNEQTGNGNPWVITTLWYGQLEIKSAKTIEDLKKAKSYIEWACSHASEGGMLSEQLNAETGEQLSATPLTWSHAEFVVTVIEYLKRYEQLANATTQL